MTARSAGLLLWRPGPEVLLVHPGGPYWARKDDGAWSVPKGLVGPGEDPLVAARREFVEELGLPVPEGEPVPLGEIRQKGGKVVEVWAVGADLDVADLRPGTFELEWPPRSGRLQAFPEVDRASWFALPEARVKLLAAQLPLLDRVAALAAGRALP